MTQKTEDAGAIKQTLPEFLRSHAEWHAKGICAQAPEVVTHIKQLRDWADEIELRAPTAELASMTRMFHAACADLGAINETLGLDPDDGGSAPILEAIAELKAQIATPVAPTAEQEDHIAGERKMVAGDGQAESARELREAARQFHNLTHGDSTVIIRPPSAEKRDAIVAAGERLRAALAAEKVAVAAQSGKPVAWRHKWVNDASNVWQYETARPQTDKLRIGVPGILSPDSARDQWEPLYAAPIENGESVQRAEVERACDRILEQSKNSLFRSGVKICAGEILSPTEACDRPPEGWACSRIKGHEGPCAAAPQPSQPVKAGEYHNDTPEHRAARQAVGIESADSLIGDMIGELQAEQTFLGSSRESCNEYDKLRWDRLQRFIDHISESSVPSAVVLDDEIAAFELKNFEASVRFLVEQSRSWEKAYHDAAVLYEDLDSYKTSVESEIHYLVNMYRVVLEAHASTLGQFRRFARAASPQATAPQPAQSPDGRVIDKAMVKRLAVQHGLTPDGLAQTQVALTDQVLTAARTLIREELDSASVHPCDEHNDEVRSHQLPEHVQNLYRALLVAQPASGGDHD